MKKFVEITDCTFKFGYRDNETTLIWKLFFGPRGGEGISLYLILETSLILQNIIL